MFNVELPKDFGRTSEWVVPDEMPNMYKRIEELEAEVSRLAAEGDIRKAQIAELFDRKAEAEHAARLDGARAGMEHFDKLYNPDDLLSGKEYDALAADIVARLEEKK